MHRCMHTHTHKPINVLKDYIYTGQPTAFNFSRVIDDHQYTNLYYITLWQ